jgi:hypothetical protein
VISPVTFRVSQRVTGFGWYSDFSKRRQSRNKKASLSRARRNGVQVRPMATSLRSAAAPRGLAPSTPPASARCDRWLARDRARGTRGLAAAVRGSTRRLAIKGDGAPDLRGAGAGLGDQLSVVMKFGGSSVSSPARMEEVAGLVLAFPEERPVLVLSAMGKTTNLLLLVLIATYTALKLLNFSSTWVQTVLFAWPAEFSVLTPR